MTQQVQTNGFSVPPVPGNATQHSREAGPLSPPPPSNQQVPGFVTPAPQAQQPAPQGLTTEQIAAMYAAQTGQQPPAVPPTPPAPQRPVPPVVPPTPVPQAPAVSPELASDVGTDPLLVSMTSILSTSVPGLDLDRAIGKAIEFGDTRLIDMAYLREKGGANAAHALALAEGIVQRVQAQTNEATQAVYSVAGDQAQWQAASAAFNASAPQHMKVVIATLLDSGNKDSIKAAAQTVVDFARGSGFIATPGQFINAGATGGNAAQALDKVGFQEALRKLDKNSRTFEQDRAELFARRGLGKSLGR